MNGVDTLRGHSVSRPKVQKLSVILKFNKLNRNLSKRFMVDFRKWKSKNSYIQHYFFVGLFYK